MGRPSDITRKPKLADWARLEKLDPTEIRALIFPPGTLPVHWNEFDPPNDPPWIQEQDRPEALDNLDRCIALNYKLDPQLRADGKVTNPFYITRRAIEIAANEACLQTSLIKSREAGAKKARAQFDKALAQAKKISQALTGLLKGETGQPGRGVPPHPEQRTGTPSFTPDLKAWREAYSNDISEIMLMERVIRALERRSKAEQQSLKFLRKQKWIDIYVEEIGKLWVFLTGKAASSSGDFSNFVNDSLTCLGARKPLSQAEVRTIINRVEGREEHEGYSAFNRFDAARYYRDQGAGPIKFEAPGEDVPGEDVPGED